MNVVFVGGGSFRTLPIVRQAMAVGTVLQGGRIWLVDFNLERAETVGRLLLQAPELAGSGCEVRWTDQLDEALPEADVVSVSFPVGSHRVNRRSEEACAEHGLFGSDQLSVSGAFRAVTGGTVVLGIARRMEQHCPRAWLIDFANPVAVYSGLVNNHTRIRALGLCGGFTNHRWDLTRLLFNRDEYCDEFQVACAGVNHCSILLRGTWRGEDIYTLLDRQIQQPGWQPCRTSAFPHLTKYIHASLKRLAEMRRRFGTIMFSTEGDGMMHLFFEEMRDHMLKSEYTGRMSAAAMKSWEQQLAASRRQADAAFHAFLERDLDAAFWAQGPRENPYIAAGPDATASVLKALNGERQWLAASLPNRGAVKGFKDRTVLEYSLHLDQEGVHPDADLEVPDCFHGLISALATHQTLLGDAIAARDPKLFADALFCYPLNQNTRATKALWRKLLTIHQAEIPPEFQKAKNYF